MWRKNVKFPKIVKVKLGAVSTYLNFPWRSFFRFFIFLNISIGLAVIDYQNLHQSGPFNSLNNRTFILFPLWWRF